jgi:hypothetical protein
MHVCMYSYVCIYRYVFMYMSMHVYTYTIHDDSTCSQPARPAALPAHTHPHQALYLPLLLTYITYEADHTQIMFPRGVYREIAI